MFDIKKYISGIFVGSMLITSANAQEFNFDYSEDIYLKFYTGFNDIQDQGMNESSSFAGVTVNADYEWGFETGWTVGTILGYPLFDPSIPFFGNLRGEVDASYSKAYADDIDGSVTLTGDDESVTISGSAEVNGKVEIVDFYNNFIFNVRDYNIVQPYFGLGIGFSYIEHNVEDIAGEVFGIMEKDTSIGVQFVLGADLFASNNFSGGARIVGRQVSNSREGVDSVQALGGQFDIRYNF